MENRSMTLTHEKCWMPTNGVSISYRIGLLYLSAALPWVAIPRLARFEPVGSVFESRHKCLGRRRTTTAGLQGDPEQNSLPRQAAGLHAGCRELDF